VDGGNKALLRTQTLEVWTGRQREPSAHVGCASAASFEVWRDAGSDGTEVIGLSDPVHQNRSTEVLIGVTALLDVQSYSIILITACYASLYMF
jgi:hypothetical protein